MTVSLETAEYTAVTQYRKFETYISRKGIAGLSSDVHIHLSVSDLYIYSHDRSAYSAAGKYVDMLEIYKTLTGTGMWKL
jgi:hypothetical protein